MHHLLVTLAADAPWFTFDVPPWVANALQILKVLIGFSIIIFVHELGHFMAAKWVGVRVDRFAVGFGTRLVGWRRGEGLTFGNRPEYTSAELAERRYGETDYCFKALPFGGYVKMLGQDDIMIDDATGKVTMTADPRAFTNRPVGQRMVVVSAGVIANLLFGAVAFMVVFLMGINMEPPVIGNVQPGGPAARAGLLPGDRVLSINDEVPISFSEVFLKAIMADGPMRVRVERDGKPLDQDFIVTAEMDDLRGIPQIGIEPVLDTAMTTDGDPIEGQPNLREGDRIIQVGDQPVASKGELDLAFRRARAGKVRVVAVRKSADADQPETIDTFQRVAIDLAQSELIPGDEKATINSSHILGMVPRRRVNQVEKNTPAEAAGFKPGDIIVEWDGVSNPNWGEAISQIRLEPPRIMTVVVERSGKLVTLAVKPARVGGGLFSKGRLQVGLDIRDHETDRPVVADVRPGSPAAALRMPRGSQLLSIAGRPTPTWYDVIEVLRAVAGSEVDVRYRSDADEITARFKAPSSIVNELDLPADATILAVNGQKTARLNFTAPDGKSVEINHAVSDPYALRRALEPLVGQSVRITYAIGRGEPVEKSILITEDNVDPWQLRIRYAYASGRFQPVRERIHAHGNPLKAMWMGAKVTYDRVTEVYQTMRLMLMRRVSVSNVQGPIGIISTAVTIAKEGVVDLIFFLAFLSVNLAVINFIPIPVVDGGLMLFLIIEKIKGSPLSIKTQMISTIVGLAVIVLCFLFVTIQDVSRLFG